MLALARKLSSEGRRSLRGYPDFLNRLLLENFFDPVAKRSDAQSSFAGT